MQISPLQAAIFPQATGSFPTQNLSFKGKILTDSVTFSGKKSNPHAGLRDLLLNNVLVEGKTGVDLLEIVYKTIKDEREEFNTVQVEKEEFVWLYHILKKVSPANKYLVAGLLDLMSQVGLLKDNNPGKDPFYSLTQEGQTILKTKRPQLFKKH